MEQNNLEVDSLNRFPNVNRPGPRELELLGLIAGGMRKVQLAEAMGISPGTIHTHLRNIFTKLEAKNRTHAVAIALRKGWIEYPGIDSISLNT